jgi:hypothetical protein
MTRQNQLILLFSSFLKSKIKKTIICVGLSFYFSSAIVNAQILQDTTSLNLIKKGIDSIYNMNFSYANKIYGEISQLYPDHPVAVLFKGIMTYWENYPLLPSSANRVSFEEKMRKCMELCEKADKHSYEPEYLLADLCSRGLLLSFYANNDLSDAVFPLATSTYKYLKKSFDYTSVYPDFFFFAGLYNYYREVYVQVHPVYKPLTIFFRKGNKIKGLEELQTASRNSILLRAESCSELSYIYISHENNFQQALSFNRYLHDLYPVNPEYLAEYIKNLLLMKKYNEAERLIMSSDNHISNSFFQAQLFVLKGILQEKKYNNNSLAQEYYNKAASDISSFGTYGNEYAAYAYFGLSRISGINGDKEHKKIYRKHANKLTDLKKINFDL